MIPVIVTLFIWAIVALAFGALCAYAGFRFMIQSRAAKKTAENFVRTVETRVKKEQNKFAALSQDELNSVLTVLFARKLILCSDQDISEKEIDAHEKLLAHAQSAVITYLGDETVAAIEYHYGEGYIHRWCHEAYLALEYDSIASSIIKKERDVKSVARHIAEWF